MNASVQCNAVTYSWLFAVHSSDTSRDDWRLRSTDQSHIYEYYKRHVSPRWYFPT